MKRMHLHLLNQMYLRWLRQMHSSKLTQMQMYLHLLTLTCLPILTCDPNPTNQELLCFLFHLCR